MNREEWLGALVMALIPMIEDQGEKVPGDVNISVSFPSKKATGKRRAVGQCWYPEQAEDKRTNIFVSPVLSDPLEVAETVLHELVHAAVGPGHGHKGPFITLAKALGFTKPWTSTPASDTLQGDLRAILEALPPYPHGALDASAAEKGSKPQTTRMVKVECVNCGYTLRTTKKWIEVGLPTCVCSGEIQETGKEG